MYCTAAKVVIGRSSQLRTLREVQLLAHGDRDGTEQVQVQVGNTFRAVTPVISRADARVLVRTRYLVQYAAQALPVEVVVQISDPF